MMFSRPCECIVAQNGSITARQREKIADSSLSPRYFLWHNMMGKSARPGPLKCDLQRHVIGKRMKYLRISWRHQIPFEPSFVSGIHCMDVDPVDNRYLLCGACCGEISFVDLERPLPPNSWSSVEHRIIPCRAARPHGSMVTYCQWYPQDTSSFISSSTDGKVKLWDANRSEVVDEYCFDREIPEMHWCNAFVRNPLIAVANSTSNIALIDPRAGDSSQNLKWSNEHAVSLRWSLENGNILATGSVYGKLAIWDVRSSRSHLKTVTPSTRFMNYTNSFSGCISGIRFSKDGLYLVSFSADGVFTIWRPQTMKLINEVWLPSEYLSYRASSTRYDICSDDGVLRACMPVSDDVLILSLDKKDEDFRILLVGHFQRVSVCVYRQKCHQVISSGNDRMIHIWSPYMDEHLPDQQLERVSRLEEDNWSDVEEESSSGHMR